MRIYKHWALFMVLLATPLAAQEKGAIQIYGNGGLSFGLTNVVGVKERLLAPGGGIRVNLSRYLLPFFDFTYIDGKKVTATGLSQQLTYNVMHGGVRVPFTTGQFRPYAQFGVGKTRASFKGSFANLSGSDTSYEFGGGVQMFISSHFGVDIGASAAHVPDLNFSLVRFGMFYQTKSAE
jgi:hypothetical protein